MLTLRMFAVAAYGLVGLGLIAQGFRYLVASRYMHYHADVVHEGWGQLKKSEQRLILGLLRGFGAGMFCVGFTTVFVSVGPFRDGAYLASWFLAILSIAYTVMLVRVTRFALLPKAAPIMVTSIMLGLSVAAALAGWLQWVV
jgi:hypothetical protein